MKVITFSRFFPAKHPRKAEPTYFVEKILAGLDDLKIMWTSVLDIPKLIDRKIFVDCEEPKWHTVRAGNRWNVGDSFSPRVWSECPYRSKQIIIAPPIKIKKIWDFNRHRGDFFINKEPVSDETLMKICRNDGLQVQEFSDWFPSEHFSGQIICWNDNIEYV